MDTGYIVLIVFLSVWVLLFAYSQLVSPLLLRREFARELARRGWSAVAVERELAWNDVMTLAVEENRGASSVREYDDRYGPLATHSRIAEKRSGGALRVYRDAGVKCHRYAALGKKIEEVDSGDSSLLAHRQRHRYTGSEVWIGEARRIPVERPELVFSGFAAMFGEAARKLADKRGVDPETIPAAASPSEDTSVQAVREILLASSLAADALAKVYIGPRSWVMTVPLKRLGSRTGELIGLAGRISEAIDRLSE